MKYYAGIGSRKTPKEILDLMSVIGEYLQSKGYILRSGGHGLAGSAPCRDVIIDGVEQ